jgi:hypothetical protein
MDSMLDDVMALAGSVLELPLHLAYFEVMLKLKTEKQKLHCLNPRGPEIIPQPLTL